MDNETQTRLVEFRDDLVYRGIDKHAAAYIAACVQGTINNMPIDTPLIEALSFKLYLANIKVAA